MIERTKRKAKKRILSVFLGMLVLFAMMAFASITSFAATSGDYEYSVSYDGTASITGYNGSYNTITIPSTIDGYTVTSIAVRGFGDNTILKSVTMPNTITKIGSYAFENCSALQSVTLSNSLTSISAYAFKDCKNLTNINISNSVESIGAYAFKNCKNLASVAMPNNLTSIGENAFENCSSITSASIPSGVTRIESYTFSGCSSLSNLTIGNNVTSIGTEAFYNCTSLSSVTIPNSVTEIGNLAFEYCTNLKNLTLGNSLSRIGDNAFFGCAALKSVTIPNSVYFIGGGAFCGCSSITSIEIPKSVEYIKSNAFGDCSKLTSINVASGNEYYLSQNGVLFNADKTTLIQYPAGKSGSYSIPNGVTKIEVSAFAGCGNLSSVTIPSSVKIIDNHTFEDCKNLTSVTIPNSVTGIGSSAFENCSSLTNVTIPSSVTYINLYAFAGCSSLARINLPNSAIQIHNWAFNDTAYYNNKSNWENDVLYIGNHLIKAKETISGKYAVKNGTLTIAINAFQFCDSLTSVTIPNSMIYMSYNAFYYNRNLNSVIIADGVKRIDRMSFYYNPNLSSVVIPKSVTNIDYDAFASCYSLKDVYYAGTKDQWNKISIDTGNSCLTDATIHYNYVPQLSTPKISSVSNTATGVKVTWGKVDGAEKYRVFYKTAGGSWTGIANTTATSYTWKGAKSGTKYTFTVRCVDKDGKNFTSAYDTTGKTLTYIAAPKLSAVANTATGVKISWGKVTGAAKYRVFYKANGESTWHKAGDTTGTSYTWKGAKSGTKYTFTVRCVDKDGKNFTSAYDTTGKTLTYIAAPKLSSVSNTTTGVKISWGKVTGAAKYRVFYKTGNGSWKKIADTTSTSYTWKGAKSGTKYTFTVRCVDKDGKNFTSAYNTTGKSLTYIAAPKLSSVTNTTTGVKISWGKVTGAAKYRVFYKTGNGSWKKIADTTSTSYTWKGAKSGTKYTFTVRCISKDGKSFTSAYNTTGKSITYVAAPKISSLSKSSSGVTVKWDKVTGAAKYRVFYKTGNGSWKKLADTTSTSYTWKGAKSGTKYTFTVRCISKDGKSFTSAYNTTGKSITR